LLELDTATWDLQERICHQRPFVCQSSAYEFERQEERIQPVGLDYACSRLYLALPTCNAA
jgi:hypothetical protein